MLSDLKFAFRSLLKSPGFTVIAVVTLMLGIGAITAIFSVVNAVMLRPLPYAQPDRLARIYSEFPEYPNGGMRRNALSGPEYLALQRQTTSWESIDGWVRLGANIATADKPMRVPAALVTGGMFHSLGVAPALGRFITPQDDVPGAAQAAVLSHGLWQRAFAGDRAIIGRELFVNGMKCIIVGVMPEGFRFPPGEADAPEVWGALQLNPAKPGGVTAHYLSVLGRLKSGVTLDQAQAELNSFVKHEKQIGAGHLDPKFHTLVSYGFHDEIVRAVKPALRMLLGAVCFLLLIACVNVANLLLARAEVRQREIAIRGALGAGLWRLARQFATEGILLSSLGAMGGLLLAHGGVQFIRMVGEAQIPRSAEIGIDGPVVLFAIALSLFTGLMFGLAPLIHDVARRNLHGAMKSAAASTSGQTGTQRFRQALVVSELAFALILLAGTGLMLRAFWKLQQVDVGFEPKNVTTMLVNLPDATSTRSAGEFWSRFSERLGALPGVRHAALTSTLPPLQQPNNNDTLIEGFVPTKESPVQTAEFYKVVSPGYFKTLQVRLLEGRLFDERDSPQAPGAVIINQAMARTFWADQSAVGRRLRTSFSTDWYTVIGVVADVKNAGVESRTGTEIYFPHTQITQYDAEYSSILRQAYVVARSEVEPASIVRAARGELSKIDPTLPLSRVLSLEDVMFAAQSRSRFITLLLTLFAGVALVLAATGIYGVISYGVSQRTKEFGVRMALGAKSANVLRLVLGGGLVMGVLGVAVGLAGAFALTRFLSGLLFGVTATDPATFVAVSALLGVVALVASYIPARRATAVDPMIALRAE